MNGLIILAIVAASLFAIGFFSKRRIGLLVLGATAGSVLSGLWTNDLTPLVEQSGVQLVAPPLSSVVAIMLVALPALLLTMTGLKVSNKTTRLIMAAVFTVTTLAYMVGPIGQSIVLEGPSQQIYAWLTAYQSYIITAGLIYALYDLVTAKAPKAEDGKKGKH